MKQQFLSLRKTAEYLDVSIHCVYKLIQTNTIPYYKPRGLHSKLTYVDLDELEAWIRKARYDSQEEIEQQTDAYLAKKETRL